MLKLEVLSGVGSEKFGFERFGIVFKIVALNPRDVIPETFSPSDASIVNDHKSPLLVL